MSDTGRRDAVLRGYVGAEPQPQAEQPDTGRFQVVERPAYYPVDRPLCGQHSGVCVRMDHVEADIRELHAVQGEQEKRIGKVESLAWRVIGAATGGGAVVAGLVELVKWAVAAGG